MFIKDIIMYKFLSKSRPVSDPHLAKCLADISINISVFLSLTFQLILIQFHNLTWFSEHRVYSLKSIGKGIMVR